MKTTVQKAKVAAAYPCLKITKAGTVVLFTAPGVGVCLESGTVSFAVLGDHRTIWDEAQFYPFKGEVVLRELGTMKAPEKDYGSSYIGCIFPYYGSKSKFKGQILPVDPESPSCHQSWRDRAIRFEFTAANEWEAYDFLQVRFWRDDPRPLRSGRHLAKCRVQRPTFPV